MSQITPAQSWAIEKMLDALGLSLLQFETGMGRSVASLSEIDARGYIKQFDKDIKRQRKEGLKHVKNNQPKQA